MRLFHLDASFDLVLEIILNLRRFSTILPKTYTEAVDTLRNKKEGIAARYREQINSLKSYGFSEEKIEEIIKEYELNVILKALEAKISKEDTPKFLEEIKLEFETIKLRTKDILLFEELLKTKKDLQICEDILRRIEEIKVSGKIGEVERVFSEIADLEIWVRSDPEDIKRIRDFVGILCREINDHTLLPFIEMLNLECMSILSAVKALDFLVSRNLIDCKNFLNSISNAYLPWSDFIVFIFLLAHAQKILSYEELSEGIGLHRWKESWEYWKSLYRSQEREPLLNLSKMLIIPLSLRNRIHARLALALAALVASDQKYKYNLNLFEDFCRSLMKVGKYGEDEIIGKLLNYSYFYGDLEVIIRVGKLAGIKGSLEGALNELKTLVE